MKSYRITVNGNVYDVTVEETTGNGAVAVTQTAPTPAPQQAKTEKAVSASAGNAGSVEIKSSVPGKVIAVEAKAGQTVKTGDTVVILESMKMEIPVVAPQDGIITSITVSQGSDVENGAVLATMN